MHPIMLLFLVDLIVVAPLTGWLANQKGRSPSGWFVAAVIGGPLAMLAVGLAPSRWRVEEDRRLDGRCPRCDNRVSATARHCPSCDTQLPQMAQAVSASTAIAAPDQEPTARPSPPAPRPQTRSIAEETIAPRVTAPSVRPPDVRATPAPEPIVARATEARQESAPPPVADDEPGGTDLSQRRGVSNIASGVFAGGVSELGAGYRYLISTSPTMLYISGPIDVAPTKIVFQSPRPTVDASHFEGDLVIVAESPIGRKRQLVFRGIAGADAAKVEELLARPEEPVSAPEAAAASVPDTTPARVPAARLQAARRTRRAAKPTE
ncbi:MAG: hypothetical protein ABI573_08195 [Chloroflexota bacterium]